MKSAFVGCNEGLYSKLMVLLLDYGMAHKFDLAFKTIVIKDKWFDNHIAQSWYICTEARKLDHNDVISSLFEVKLFAITS